MVNLKRAAVVVAHVTPASVTPAAWFLRQKNEHLVLRLRMVAHRRARGQSVCSQRPRPAVLLLVGLTACLPIVVAPGYAGSAHELCAARRASVPASSSKDQTVSGWFEPHEGFDVYDRLTRPQTAAAQWQLFTSPAATHSWDNVSVHADLVRLGLFVHAVWNIDQRAETFEVQVYLRMQWQDDRMCFNGTRLPPRESVRSERSDGAQHSTPARGSEPAVIELDEMSMVNTTTGVSILQSLWLPDIHFVNSIRTGDEAVPDADLLSVDEFGNVTWSRRFIVTLSAQFKFGNLPFDQQSLDVILESYRMPSTAMEIEWACMLNKDECLYSGISPSVSDNPEWGFRNITGKEQLWFDMVIEAAPSTSPGFSRALFRMDVERRREVWLHAYILPSSLLVFISYMGLFIGNHNPGRPGVHAVTILTHLTIDASIRAQLPSISDSTWITEYQSSMLNFHVVIFVEFCIVHYAHRQKKKLKKKRLQEKQVFLDAMRLDLQLHSMGDSERHAVDKLLRVVPNGWNATGLLPSERRSRSRGTAATTSTDTGKDKRLRKVQQNLELSDKQLEQVIRECGSTLLASTPRLSAAELVTLCYGGAF